MGFIGALGIVDTCLCRSCRSLLTRRARIVSSARFAFEWSVWGPSVGEAVGSVQVLVLSGLSCQGCLFISCWILRNGLGLYESCLAPYVFVEITSCSFL